MRQLIKSYTSGAASTTGLAASVTGASWSTTTTAPTDGFAHLITITGLTATNHSGKTAVITGTDTNGVAQTETIAALPNGAVTVTSTKYFKTVSTVVPSATIGADTMSLGWAADSVTPWYPVANYSQPGVFNMGFVVEVVSGSPNYTMQATYDEILAVDHGTVTGETTTQEGAYTEPRAAVRLKFTAAGVVKLTMMVAHL